MGAPGRKRDRGPIASGAEEEKESFAGPLSSRERSRALPKVAPQSGAREENWPRVFPSPRRTPPRPGAYRPSQPHLTSLGSAVLN